MGRIQVEERRGRPDDNGLMECVTAITESGATSDSSIALRTIVWTSA